VVREQVLGLLSQMPRDYGLADTRWTLDSLLRVGTQLKVGSIAGLWRVLRRLGIRYRRGWEHLVSPDPWASEKLAWIAAVIARGRLHPGRVVVLWLDELTFYRLPSVAALWSDGQSRHGPKARHSSGANTKGRVGAAMNPYTGQVCSLLRSKCGVTQLKQLYQLIRQTYPQAEEIYVIQDCWPTHFNPEVLHTATALDIALMPLPTYSSWRNPIEKLWRWLRQTLLHMHPWTDDWPRLKQEVRGFLDLFTQPNTALLRYVGLPY
jgi:hypothetical protein